ncbi:MAG TPA: hypothetical protein VME86_18590 [Acidobacteriaceae bacterium]|nr:hypothetical protein [Acidobacteriaceae bacterium]
MAAALLLAACAAYAEKQKQEPKPEVVPAPIVRIAVTPLGFLPPSPAYLSLRLSWSSLNFIDPEHLLFTFHLNELLRRPPGAWWDSDGQMIRADVLDIRTGKVVKQAQWMMNDRGRYIWALRNGKFMVRRRNSLYLTDSSLELKPYLVFETDLQGVEISPRRRLMMLEVKKVTPVAAGDGGGNVPSLLGADETKPVEQTRTEMVLLHPGERTVLARAELRIPRSVPLMDDGVVETMNGDNPRQWMLEMQTIHKTMEKVGMVVSDCAPQVQALGSDVVLALGCPPNEGNGSTVVAMKMGGEVLWHDRWESRYIWPTFDYSEDGQRFAYESLQADRDIGTLDSFGEADIVAQPVGVFDTETGKLVLVEDATPILSAGQNFALSADGREFAILQDGAIEVYDLPPVSVKAVETAEKKK